MNRIRLLTWAVLGLVVINLGMVAFLLLRRPTHLPGFGPNREGPKRLIINQLDLTEAQTIRYEQLIEQHQAAIGRLNAEIRQTKNKLYATLTTGNQTPNYSLINQLGALQRQVEMVHYNHFMALRKICTSSQYPQFNELTTKLADYFAHPGRPSMRR